MSDNNIKTGSLEWYVLCTSKINKSRIVIRAEIARIELKNLVRALNTVGYIASQCGVTLRETFNLLYKLQHDEKEA